MSMTDWAEKEVEIACKRERVACGGEENENNLINGWDYGCACYKSALKAFKSLMEDGHSGCSIGLTKQILNRLIDGRPLTPIEDTPDIWNLVTRGYNDGTVEYQCSRISSLFKTVAPDGTVTYSDVDRVYCVSHENESITYRSSLVMRLINKMYPITMPYAPGDSMCVVCEDFLTDPRNGDFDTVGILYIPKNNGTRESINRYFKEGDRDWIEISEEEYEERRLIAEALKGETNA